MSLFRPYELTSTTTTTPAITPVSSAVNSAAGPTPSVAPGADAHTMHQQMAMLLAAHTAAAAARAAEVDMMARRSTSLAAHLEMGQRPRSHSPISDPGSPPPQSPPTCESPVTLMSGSPNHHD